MLVHVELFAYLAKYSPTGKEKLDMELVPETSLGQLLERLSIPPDVEKRVLVNGRQTSLSARLADGDDVFIFPPVAGG